MEIGLFVVGFAIGVGIGWVIAEKPEWARNVTDTVKSKFAKDG